MNVHQKKKKKKLQKFISNNKKKKKQKSFEKTFQPIEIITIFLKLKYASLFATLTRPIVHRLCKISYKLFYAITLADIF